MPTFRNIPAASIHRLPRSAPDTRRNFGPRHAEKSGEAGFLEAFEVRFLEAHRGSGIVAEEFALPAYGVADMAWIGWKSGTLSEFAPSSRTLSQAHLFAFEAKLKDWQRALRQAFRYRYFADKSIVLLPFERIKTPLANLATFQQLHVGLWSFEETTQCIRQHFTPVRVKALNQDARRKAVALLTSHLDLRQLRKQFDSAA